MSISRPSSTPPSAPSGPRSPSRSPSRSPTNCSFHVPTVLVGTAVTALGLHYFPDATIHFLKQGWDIFTHDDTYAFLESSHGKDSPLTVISELCRNMKNQFSVLSHLSNDLTSLEQDCFTLQLSLTDIKNNPQHLSLKDLNKKIDVIIGTLNEKKNQLQILIDQSQNRYSFEGTKEKIIPLLKKIAPENAVAHFVQEIEQKIQLFQTKEANLHQLLEQCSNQLKHLNDTTLTVNSLLLSNISEFTDINTVKFSCSSHSTEIDAQHALLGVEEYNTLPKNGSIDPTRLRWAQPGCSSTFTQSGEKLESLTQAILANPNTPLTKVDIGVYQGKVYCFNTRRLVAYMKAWEQNPNVTILYKKCVDPPLTRYIQTVFESKPGNGIAVAYRFNNKKGSESELYVNPRYKDALRPAAATYHEMFPSNRKAVHDANGFNNRRSSNQTFYRYLCDLRDKPSTPELSSKKIFAKRILDHLNNIYQTKGKRAMTQELTRLKNYLNH
ncbi:hypothetical protein OAJ27_00400 [bacterium]|nr:hypothetical protein [bacterium]